MEHDLLSTFDPGPFRAWLLSIMVEICIMFFFFLIFILDISQGSGMDSLDIIRRCKFLYGFIVSFHGCCATRSCHGVLTGQESFFVIFIYCLVKWFSPFTNYNNNSCNSNACCNWAGLEIFLWLNLFLFFTFLFWQLYLHIS